MLFSTQAEAKDVRSSSETRLVEFLRIPARFAHHPLVFAHCLPVFVHHPLVFVHHQLIFVLHPLVFVLHDAEHRFFRRLMTVEVESGRAVCQASRFNHPSRCSVRVESSSEEMRLQSVIPCGRVAFSSSSPCTFNLLVSTYEIQGVFLYPEMDVLLSMIS